MANIIIRHVRHIWHKLDALIDNPNVFVRAIPVILIFSLTQILFMYIFYSEYPSDLLLLGLIPISVFGLCLLSLVLYLVEIFGKTFSFISIVMLIISLCFFCLSITSPLAFEDFRQIYDLGLIQIML